MTGGGFVRSLIRLRFLRPFYHRDGNVNFLAGSVSDNHKYYPRVVQVLANHRYFNAK